MSSNHQLLGPRMKVDSGVANEDETSSTRDTRTYSFTTSPRISVAESMTASRKEELGSIDLTTASINRDRLGYRTSGF